ncbi:MAG: YncE family protein [Solirubrobacterales bacterium]|nr:YncE family protein [Solirubrobacterales bacterium]
MASKAVRRKIKVGEAPEVVAISPDGAAVFVTCADGVYRIGSEDDHVSRAPEALRHPHGVTLTPDGTQAYVADSERNQVVVLHTTDLRTVARIGVGRTPWNTAFGANGSSAYVTNANDNTVSVIDTRTRKVKETLPLGSGTTTDSVTTFTQINQIPTAIRSGPDGRIWAACNASSSLVVLDPSSNTVVESIELGIGDMPTGIAFV